MLDEETQHRLLGEFQRDFPLSPTPYADIAEKLGIDEAQVLAAYETFASEGKISRIGAVFKPHSVGASTLAAISVPSERIEEAAEIINGYHEVNHNYEREHLFNLWFVVTADCQARVETVLKEIGEKAGSRVLDLPMLVGYHLDLGFKLKWN